MEQHDAYTRFQDSKGNELKVAHKHLTPKYRKEIDELPVYMAEGGEVKKPDKGPAEINKKDAEAFSKGFNKPTTMSEMAGNIKKAIGFADGGQVQEDVDTAPAGEMAIAPQPEQPSFLGLKPLNNPDYPNGTFDPNLAVIHNPNKFSVDEQLNAFQAVDAQKAQAEAKESERIANEAAAKDAQRAKIEALNVQRIRAGLEPVAVPGVEAAAQASLAQPGSPPASSSLAVAAGNPGTIAGAKPTAEQDNALATYGQGLKEQQAGIKQQASAESALAKEQLATQQTALAVQQQFTQEWESKSKAMQGTIDRATQAYETGKIDPERFVSGMGTGDRFATAIGLILGGMGAGVTGGENQALGLLKMRVNNDIDAQKSEMTKRENLVGMAYRQFGNMKDAMEYSKALQMNVLATQLNVAAAKAGSPLAQARGLQASGALKRESAEMIAKLSKDQTLNKALAGLRTMDPKTAMAGLDALESIDPKRAQDMRARFVPGLGFAPTDKDATDLKESQSALTNAMSGIDRLRQINKQSGKSLSPALRSEAETIQQSLVGLLRLPLTGPGAMNEGERKMLEGMIANPTALMALDSTNKVRLDTLQKRLEAGYANLAKSKGLSVPSKESQLDPQTQKYAAWAKTNINNPNKDLANKARVTLEKLGLNN